MQNPSFISPATVVYNGVTYPVVFLIDYVNNSVSFQDVPYHPSAIYTRPISEVTLTFN